jgi:hypothetical protein
MRPADPYTVSMTEVKLSQLRSSNDIVNDTGSQFVMINESANDPKEAKEGILSNAPHSLQPNNWEIFVLDGYTKALLERRERHASVPSAYKSDHIIRTWSLARRGDSVQGISVYRKDRIFPSARLLPVGTWELIQCFYPPFRLPNTCHQKIFDPTNPSYMRDNVIQPLALGSLPVVNGPVHHCVDCHSYRLYAHR